MVPTGLRCVRGSTRRLALLAWRDASPVPGIVLVPNAPLPRIHVTIRQDLGAVPPVESVTITNSVVPGTAGPTTYYSFDLSNTSIAPRSFVIRAV